MEGAANCYARSDGMLTAAVFGLRRVVGMGLIFESVLFVGLNIMRGFVANLSLGWWRSECLDSR